MSVPLILRQLVIRREYTTWNGEYCTEGAVGSMVEPQLRREDAEPDQVLSAVRFHREFPPQLIQEPSILDIGTSVQARSTGRVRPHHSIGTVPTVIVTASSQ